MDATGHQVTQSPNCMTPEANSSLTNDRRIELSMVGVGITRAVESSGSLTSPDDRDGTELPQLLGRRFSRPPHLGPGGCSALAGVPPWRIFRRVRGIAHRESCSGSRQHRDLRTISLVIAHPAPRSLLSPCIELIREIDHQYVALAAVRHLGRECL